MKKLKRPIPSKEKIFYPINLSNDSETLSAEPVEAEEAPDDLEMDENFEELEPIELTEEEAIEIPDIMEPDIADAIEAPVPEVAEIASEISAGGPDQDAEEINEEMVDSFVITADETEALPSDEAQGLELQGLVIDADENQIEASSMDAAGFDLTHLGAEEVSDNFMGEPQPISIDPESPLDEDNLNELEPIPFESEPPLNEDNLNELEPIPFESEPPLNEDNLNELEPIPFESEPPLNEDNLNELEPIPFDGGEGANLGPISFEQNELVAPDDYQSDEGELSNPFDPGKIYVKEEDDVEEHSLYPTAPFQKIDLPLGYTWEGDLIMCEKDGATMVYVPEGAFIMGYEGDDASVGESPEHEIILGGFLVDECPVTWYQYNHFCEETGRKKPTAPNWELDEGQPVINVTWEDAYAYAQWAGKSLPTEAQWEKAAKGGIFFDGDTMMIQKNRNPMRRYPWGNDAPGSRMTWSCNCKGAPEYGDRSPSPVGTYQNPDDASPYGCLDMAGNVWEWCNDWYSDIYYQSCPNSNPKGPRTGNGKVVRGGAWNSDPYHVTTTFRGWMEKDDWWNVIGFRTVFELR